MYKPSHSLFEYEVVDVSTAGTYRVWTDVCPAVNLLAVASDEWVKPDSPLYHLCLLKMTESCYRADLRTVSAVQRSLTIHTANHRRLTGILPEHELSLQNLIAVDTANVLMRTSQHHEWTNDEPLIEELVNGRAPPPVPETVPLTILNEYDLHR